MGNFEKRWIKTFDEMQVLKAEWMITRNCSLHCSYCRICDSSTLVGKELSTGELIQTVKMFGELWPGAPMVVYGGEPTERDDLVDLIAAGRKYGVKLPVISNSIRVMRDKEFREALVSAGLDNWSVSLDHVAGGTIDRQTLVKSKRGLEALLMFRDGYGIRDLVACVTVTRHNVDELPMILQELTFQGVHAIFTPLHVGRVGYEYAGGIAEDLPAQSQIDLVAPRMYEMVKSGHYLCSNDAGWFSVWPEHFLRQDWMCNDKGLVTIDADGSLKYCVDIPFRPEDRMLVHELGSLEGRNRFLEVVQKGPPCQGCLWNPAYECIKRARDPGIGIEEGRKRSRHTVSNERSSSLFGGAGKYFLGNENLRQVQPEIPVEEAIENAKGYAGDPGWFHVDALLRLNRDRSRRLSEAIQDESDGSLRQSEEIDSAVLRILLHEMQSELRRIRRFDGPAMVLGRNISLDAGAGDGSRKGVIVGILGGEYLGVEAVPELAAKSGDVRWMLLEEMPDEWAGKFRYIVAHGVMAHVFSPRDVLRKLKRVLAPGGLIGHSTPHPWTSDEVDLEPAHVTQFRLDEWLRLYSELGFESRGMIESLVAEVPTAIITAWIE